MRSLIHAGAGAVALIALVALPLSASGSADPAVVAAPGGDAPAVGEIVNYKFRVPPMNAGGLTDLADFRGRPVLIEYWGTR